MDLCYSEDQQLIADTARRLLADQYPAPGAGAGDGKQRWRSQAEMGWMGLPVSESHGGTGGGAVDVGILMEAFGERLVHEPYVPTVVLAAGLIQAMGTPAQKDGYLPGIVEGVTKAAVYMPERRHGAALDRIGATVTRVDGGWQASGSARLVSGGDAADIILVPVRAGESAYVAIVANDARGLIVRPVPTIDRRGAADLTLNSVALPDDALLGDGDVATVVESLDDLTDRAAVAYCFDACGAMSAAIETTQDYLRTRVQFGQPLSKFQAVQHHVARMIVQLEEARQLSMLAALKIDGGSPNRSRAIAAAKFKTGRAARFVGQTAVHLHGGMGMTDELVIGHYFKRLTGFQATFGSTADQPDRYSALMTTPEALSQGAL